LEPAGACLLLLISSRLIPQKLDRSRGRLVFWSILPSLLPALAHTQNAHRHPSSRLQGQDCHRSVASFCPLAHSSSPRARLFCWLIIYLFSDRGGTFCDCVAILPDQCFLVKLLSVDPAHYSDAPTEGIRRIMERVTGQAIPRGTLIDTSRIEWIRMGTTVATNALLERKGSKHALLITRGFADLLSIGNQARPKLFDLHIKKPEILYDRVVEVQERVALVHNSEDPGLGEIVKGLSGDLIRIVEPLSTS
jgi:hypothetical protein